MKLVLQHELLACYIMYGQKEYCILGDEEVCEMQLDFVAFLFVCVFIYGLFKYRLKCTCLYCSQHLITM
jgi:hypothetical protein